MKSFDILMLNQEPDWEENKLTPEQKVELVDSLLEEYQQLQAENTAIKEILEAALEHCVANRGGKRSFYKCHTYPHGKFPRWVPNAETAVREYKEE